MKSFFNGHVAIVFYVYFMYILKLALSVDFCVLKMFYLLINKV